MVPKMPNAITQYTPPIRRHVSRIAIADAYEDYRGLIFHIAKRFARRYGMDWMECIGDAYAFFVEAYSTYDAKKGDLAPRIGTYVYNKLCRVHTRKRLHVDVDPDTVGTMEPNREWIMDLDDDSKFIIKLIFNTPPELGAAIRIASPGSESMKRVIRKYLLSIGWDSDRIDASFVSIMDALEIP